jgi:hypothetical protein
VGPWFSRSAAQLTPASLAALRAPGDNSGARPATAAALRGSLNARAETGSGPS